MKNIYLILFVSSVLFVACKTESTKVDKVAKASFNTFGEEFEEGEVITIDKGLSMLESQDSALITLTGEIKEVCKMKGCWMTLVDSDQNQVHVKFKDYGFFVPTELEGGEEAILTGVLYKSETSVDELRHYAEDAGKSEEEIAAITEAEEEYKFMATGVHIYE